MKKMLFITAYPPSNQGGGEIVTLDAIKRLSKKFEIDLVYFDFPNHPCLSKDFTYSEAVYYPSTKNCFRKIQFFPLFTRRYSKDLLEKIKIVAPNYDILFFDFSQTAIYSLYITHPYKVIRCHDVIFQKYGRKSKFILPWVKYSEKKILRSAQKVFALTKKDAELISNEYGIDSDYTTDVLNLSNYEIPDSCDMNNKFLFFGYWKRPENSEGLIWFINNVYPLLTDEKKKLLVVMGGGMPDAIKTEYLDKYNITYLGFVDDCYSEILKYAAMICPLFQGAGIKIKVLDSYATGTPVIGTEVAFEGVPYIEKLEQRCKTSHDFATVINNFSACSLEDKKKLKASFNSIKSEKNIINQL